LAVGRDALIAKTCELLKRRPVNQVTRAAVARAARVDPATIRYHFPDGQTLLLAATERLTAGFLDLVEREMPVKDASPPERMRARISALLKLHTANPFFSRLMEEISQMKSAAARKLLADLTQRGSRAYTAIVESGVADGSFHSTNPALVFLAVVGLCQYFVTGAPVVRLALGGNLRQSEIEDQYLEFICDLLLDSLKRER
jgi:AcrR family transcriptional regulator